MDFIAWFEAYLGGQGISSMRGITPAGLAAAIHPRILRYAGQSKLVKRHRTEE
jgi:hypothetical protein